MLLEGGRSALVPIIMFKITVSIEVVTEISDAK